jgi:hypothetical protein
VTRDEREGGSCSPSAMLKYKRREALKLPKVVATSLCDVP